MNKYRMGKMNQPASSPPLRRAGGLPQRRLLRCAARSSASRAKRTTSSSLRTLPFVGALTERPVAELRAHPLLRVAQRGGVAAEQAGTRPQADWAAPRAQPRPRTRRRSPGGRSAFGRSPTERSTRRYVATPRSPMGGARVKRRRSLGAPATPRARPRHSRQSGGYGLRRRPHRRAEVAFRLLGSFGREDVADDEVGERQRRRTPAPLGD